MASSRFPVFPSGLRMFLLATPALLLAFAQLSAQITNVETRTPKEPAEPRLNGPGIFGVRPGHPVFYHVPATGERPLTFSIRGLPKGLQFDLKAGLLTGTLQKPGEYVLNFRATNGKGTAQKKVRIAVGEEIALT